MCRGLVEGYNFGVRSLCMATLLGQDGEAMGSEAGCLKRSGIIRTPHMSSAQQITPEPV